MINNERYKKEMLKRKRDGEKTERKRDKYRKIMNKTDGKVMTCFNCGSKYHLANQCDREETVLHMEIVSKEGDRNQGNGEVDSLIRVPPMWQAGSG